MKHVLYVRFICSSNFSSVFATASYQSVRVWSLIKKQELLRIVVPNFSAATVIFSYDGQSIITAWNDGIIRAFTPLTGNLIYTISNAHNKGFYQFTHQSDDINLMSINENNSSFVPIFINTIFMNITRLFSIDHIELR